MAIQRILVADDEESIRWVLSKALKKQGFSVDLAEDGSQARSLAQKNHYDLAILDIKMPGVQGLDLLKLFRAESPDTLIIIMTAEATMENAVSAMKHGAYDYLTKPFDLTALDAIILKAEKAADLTGKIDHLKEELQDHYSVGRAIIGNSQAMQDIYKILGRAAGSDVTILVTGESGTGKELIARAIHVNSQRLGKPLIALNCAAIPHELLETELFGHERGAFTGATERKIGKFEQANGGTLFLDEIGDMPLELQAKLLRVLQEKEITRTGGNQTIQVDVRIVAATNQDILSRVKEKQFREDLYYRLNVVPIKMPPLRERRDDIPLLADFFLQKSKQDLGIDAMEYSEELLELFKTYNWPGNVRELENNIKRAALLSPNQVLTPLDFPDLLEGKKYQRQDESLETLVAQKLENSLSQMNLHEMDTLYEMVLHQVERPLINIVLQKTRGNQIKAAQILGINRNTLRKKIKTLEIDVKRGDA
ncbi:two component, sigma54 specific, transcriptional regulator, Fis family [Desulfuromusa kysingii]|uniref:DNA-binding transcriptional regulator NtrC n=1 Tax=Desulfuromusa kysingii TaxID=37625 RepID=A0A1H3Y324_9BACT|nr:sigma-54 dependent transcriptional regulator [Desulfuromusa kysingii]SEA06049.1 two component, sigma54 specific, transcriptional regulator, Fis family [Desulfuromusa kysingii]